MRSLTASSMDSPCSMKPERHVSTGPRLLKDLGRPKSACSPSTDSTSMMACKVAGRFRLQMTPVSGSHGQHAPTTHTMASR